MFSQERGFNAESRINTDVAFAVILTALVKVCLPLAIDDMNENQCM